MIDLDPTIRPCAALDQPRTKGRDCLLRKIVLVFHPEAIERLDDALAIGDGRQQSIDFAQPPVDSERRVEDGLQEIRTHRDEEGLRAS